MYRDYLEKRDKGLAVLKYDATKTLVYDETKPETRIPEATISTALPENTPELLKASIEEHEKAKAEHDRAIESEKAMLADLEALKGQK